MNYVLNKLKEKLGIYPWWKKIIYILIAVVIIGIAAFLFFTQGGLRLIIPNKGDNNGGATGKANPNGTDSPDETLAKSIDKKLNEIEKFLD